MKKQYTYLLLICCMLFALNAQSQNCRIIQDSVTTGDDATAFSIYHYNNQNKMVKVDFYDSASLTVNYWDTITYNANDLIDEVESYYVGNPIAFQSVRFTYDINNRLTRIFESGINGYGNWAKAFDLSYNGAGLLSDLDLDATSIVGSPEGFNASFKNITWLNGNLMFVHIIGDMGAGQDTLELEVLSDSKNNISHKLYITEAPDLLMHSNTNNILEITFLYNEAMGPMGTLALKNSFTYNIENDVETWTQWPAVFDDADRTTWYDYDCTVVAGVTSINKNNYIEIYPNPFISSIDINFTDYHSNQLTTLFIKDIFGRTVAEKIVNVTNSKIEWKELNDLAPGNYIIQIYSGNDTFVQKLIKN